MQILQTERLTLREITTGDAEFMLALLNDPSWIKFIGDRGVRTIEQAKNYIDEKMIMSYRDHGFGLYVTELKENKTPIGLCGLVKRDSIEDVEIGFAFLPDFTGKGFGYESASATMEFAKKNLNIKRIVAITDPRNIKSQRLLNKIGLQFEKTIKFEGGSDGVAFFVPIK